MYNSVHLYNNTVQIVYLSDTQALTGVWLISPTGRPHKIALGQKLELGLTGSTCNQLVAVINRGNKKFECADVW